MLYRNTKYPKEKRKCVSENTIEKEDDSDSKDDLTKIILKDIAKQIKFNSVNDLKFFNKENYELRNLNDLDLNADKFKELMKLHQYNKNSVIKTIETVKLYNELSESTADENNTAIDTFLEAIGSLRAEEKEEHD